MKGKCKTLIPEESCPTHGANVIQKNLGESETSLNAPTPVYYCLIIYFCLIISLRVSLMNLMTQSIFSVDFKASIYCLFKAEMSYKTLTFLIFFYQSALCHRGISCDLCLGADEILLTPDRESIHCTWKVHCTHIQDKGSCREIIMSIALPSSSDLALPGALWGVL